MRHISKKTYKELAIPHFKEVFEIIDTVMTPKGYPYYLIGASALALEFLEQGIKVFRGTKDIDFAVMLSRLEQYEEIMDQLKSYGFSRVQNVPHRVYNNNLRVEVDILPFGQIEQGHTIQFLDKKTELHVLGFTEVLKNAEKYQFEGMTIAVPTLPGMVLLKLIAWSDRPDRRMHDLADILHIIDHYFNLNFDEITDYHHDTFTEEKYFDKLKIGAIVLGRKVKKYLEESIYLKQSINKLLEENLREISGSAIAKEWARIKDIPLEYAFSILKSFRDELN